jgi:hypothetical protein
MSFWKFKFTSFGGYWICSLCSSGLSSPSHNSNVSDLYTTIIFNSSPQFLSTPAIVTSTPNGSASPLSAVLISESNNADVVLLIEVMMLLLKGTL